MVVRMRLNRSRTAKRRSHQGISGERKAKCDCGALRLSHRACLECGKYNGRVVIDIVARAKREARREKRREEDVRTSGEAPKDNKEEPEPAQK